MSNSDDQDLKFHSLAEIGKEVLEDLRDRPNRCFIEDGFIVFRDGAGYSIALDRCNTYPKILGWQMQLSPKQWMSLDLLMQFTIIACEHHGLQISRV
ncbi:MAG TPA: hypothetical protein VIT88_08250 [Pyrinomonadaceae bacterium]